MSVGHAKQGCPVSEYIGYTNVFSINDIGNIDAIELGSFRKPMVLKCTRADITSQFPGITVEHTEGYLEFLEAVGN